MADEQEAPTVVWVEPQQEAIAGKSKVADPDFSALLEPAPPAPPPPAPDVAHILKAYDMGDHVVLKIHEYDHTDTVNYTLLESDPYGLAPGLRLQFQRMLAAGEIALEPPPPELLE